MTDYTINENETDNIKEDTTVSIMGVIKDYLFNDKIKLKKEFYDIK